MEKNMKEEGTYMDNWVTTLCSRIQHNIVNQLYFKKKKNDDSDASWGEGGKWFMYRWNQKGPGHEAGC